MIVPAWIGLANKAELYLFLENDCDYVQDGTRLTEAERDQLANFHKQQLKSAGINYRSITGNWEERFKLACFEVENLLFKKIHEKDRYNRS
ncbi:MAG: AAA family ATPase [Flavisolibacter sp.]